MGMMGPCLWQLLNSGAKNAFRSSELRMSFWEKSISLSTTHNKSKPPTAMLMETRMNLLFHVVQRWEPFPQFLSIFLPFFFPWFMVGHKKKHLQEFTSWATWSYKRFSKHQGNDLVVDLTPFLSVSKGSLVLLLNSPRQECRTKTWNFIITFLA